MGENNMISVVEVGEELAEEDGEAGLNAVQ